MKNGDASRAVGPLAVQAVHVLQHAVLMAFILGGQCEELVAHP